MVLLGLAVLFSVIVGIVGLCFWPTYRQQKCGSPATIPPQTPSFTPSESPSLPPSPPPEESPLLTMKMPRPSVPLETRPLPEATAEPSLASTPIPSPWSLPTPMLKPDAGTSLPTDGAVKPPSLTPSPLDSALSRLEWGNIAFNHPQTLGYGQTAGIQLVLSKALAPEQLAALVKEPGVMENKTVQFNNEMAARLTGDGFTITPSTPEVQVVNPQGVTQWQWDITPKQVGALRLHLTLDAKFHYDNRDLAYTVETFNQVLPVNVVWPQSALFVAQTYWQWISTAILLPFLGWIVSWFRKSKKEAT